MEDQKRHMQSVVAVPPSAAPLCVADVLEQKRGTPEPFFHDASVGEGGGAPGHGRLSC